MVNCTRCAAFSQIRSKCRKRSSGCPHRASIAPISRCLRLRRQSVARPPESGALPADTEDDARQARTLHSSTAGAVAALAAAGVTVATGGAAAPAVAAALAAGVVAGGATYAVSTAANDQEQTELNARAAMGRLILSVRAPTAAKRAEAEAILHDTGAADLRVS